MFDYASIHSTGLSARSLVSTLDRPVQTIAGWSLHVHVVAVHLAISNHVHFSSNFNITQFYLIRLNLPS